MDDAMARAGGSVTSRAMADECALLPAVATSLTNRAAHEVTPSPVQWLDYCRINFVGGECVKNRIKHDVMALWYEEFGRAAQNRWASAGSLSNPHQSPILDVWLDRDLTL